MVDVAIMMVSGDQEKIYMGIVTAIGYAASGNEKITLPNTKPLKY